MNQPTDTRTPDARIRRSGGNGRVSTKARRAGKTPEEREAEVEALAEQLTGAVAELTSTQAWLGMLRVAARSSATARRTACCCGCRPSSAG